MLIGQLGKTPLYDYHVAQKAKMVPFAGFSMPLQYGDVGQGQCLLSSRSSGVTRTRIISQRTFIQTDSQ